MASIGPNKNLLLLADVALGTYTGNNHTPPGLYLSKQEYMDACAAAWDNTSRPAQVWYEGGTHSTPPTRRATNSAPNEFTSGSPPTQQWPVQAASHQGFTAINSAAMTGMFAPVNGHPHPRPRHMPAPAGPSGGYKQVVQKSQKYKPRITGFNRHTGENMLTKACGIITPDKGTPMPGPHRKNGRYCCPRCIYGFTRTRTVKDHFPGCVKKYGNPNGLNWFDHVTLENSRVWYFNHLPTVNEEDEVEGEEVEGEENEGEPDHGGELEHDDGLEHDHEQEQDEAGDGNIHEQHNVDGSIAQALEFDNAAGEQDEDGDSRMGDEDQGRDASLA